ncbi:MAG: glutaminyl-peptide cyclotransferase [Chloroflexota bacterium]|jgi:glutamine cyclotransferase
MHLVAAAVSLLLALPWATVGATPEPVPFLEWEVVSRRPHDTGSFTQGLLLDGQGRLFESAGQYGESDLREVDPLTGAVLRQRPQPDRHFSEGLALVGDELVQLTYREGLARRFDADTFELLERHRYEGQGWGLCYDGERLVMSNGSARLTFRDADTFEPLGSVLVTIGGEPLPRLNELECVDGEVWANVWLTDAVVRIDPDEGRVTGVLDLRGVLEPHPAEIDPSAVLNGIAYDTAADTFLVTGKYWPELIEIRLRAAGSAAGP